MSYLALLHHHRPLPAQHDDGHLLARRGYYDKGPSTTASFVLAIIYLTVILILLYETIRSACTLHIRRKRTDRQGEGDALGPVLAFAELCAMSDALVYIVYYGIRTTGVGELSSDAFNFTESTVTSEILVDLFTIGLVSSFLHDSLRATSSPEKKQFRGLEFGNYILASIFVIANIAKGILSTDFVTQWATCSSCFDNCPLSCSDLLYALSDRSAAMTVVTDALCAVLAGYWLALAIIIWRRGKRIKSPLSLPLFLLHLLLTLPPFFYSTYVAIFTAVTYFSALPATDAHYSVVDFFYFSHIEMVYLGLVILYLKREKWARRVAAAAATEEPAEPAEPQPSGPRDVEPQEQEQQAGRPT